MYRTSIRTSHRERVPSAALSLLIGLLGLISGSAYAADTTQHTYSIAAEYTSGDYGGATDTDVLFLPFAIGVETRDFRGCIEIPLIAVRGSGEVRVTGGRAGHKAIAADMGASETRTEMGLGDITVAGFHPLIRETEMRPLIEVGLSIKLPVASESDNLGTGEFDFQLGFNVVKRRAFGSLFAGLGKDFLGEPPGEDFKNPAFLSLGGSYSIGRQQSLGLVWDFSEATTASGSQSNQLTLQYSRMMTPKQLITPYLIVGQADASPDHGVGLRYSWRE